MKWSPLPKDLCPETSAVSMARLTRAVSVVLVLMIFGPAGSAQETVSDAPGTVGQIRFFVEETGYETSAETGDTQMVDWDPTPEDKPLYQLHDFRRDTRFSRKSPGFSQHRSVLDVVMEDAGRLERTISTQDGMKLDEYFTSVREVAKQLERDPEWNVKPKPSVDKNGLSDFSESYQLHMPAGQFVYDRYAKVMYDLIALAYETDSTRVISYVVRQESSGGTCVESGVSKGFHELTHHENDPRNLAELAKVDRIYLSRWEYFIDRLKSFRHPDESNLPDHTLLGFSNGIRIGHFKDRLPTCLFGGKAAGIAHLGHLRLSKKTPLSRVWHTMPDRTGIEVESRFQDSTGVIDELIV